MVKEVPIYQTGLRVTVSDVDGVWIHFSSDSGLSAVINAASLSYGRCGVTKSAVEAWIKDMKESV